MSFFIYTCWYWSVAIWCVVSHFFIGLFCLLTPSPRVNHRKLARFFVKIAARNMKLSIDTNGVEHIPQNTPCVIMANHQSLIDIMVMLIAIPYHFNFISKKEMLYVPFIGLDLFFEGDFLIDRKNPRKAKQCMDKVKKRLKNNGRVLIFPEGTRSINGELLPFKRGAFKLAAETGATIIPCYIHGSGNIVKKKSLLAQPGTVQVTFHPPIPAPSSIAKDILQQTLQQTMDTIKTTSL